MKKLDEVMELMADEMAEFKTAVLELQKLSGKIFDLSIPITTEALEKNLNIFLQKQESENEKREEILQSVDRKLKNARLIPNYLLILFGIFGILGLGLVGYFGHTFNEKLDKNFEVYRMIMESPNKVYEDYSAAFPELHGAYCQWLEENK